MKPKRLNWERVVSDLWPKIQSAILPCIVGLGWSDQSVDACGDGDRSVFELHDVRPRLASGCIFDFRGQWFFLTAGHVLHDLSRASELGRKQFRFEILEGFHRNSLAHIPLPFDQNKIFAINHSHGWDYGLVPIPPLVRDTLIANGVRYIPEDRVTSPTEQCDGYVLIGFPEEQFTTTSLVDTPSARYCQVRILHPMLPIDELFGDDVPEQFRRAGNPLVGKLVSRSGIDQSGTRATLESIVGMSGGPIIGLDFDEDSVAIRLAAVQSQWLRSSSIIVGSRAAHLVAALAQLADSADGPPS